MTYISKLLGAWILRFLSDIVNGITKPKPINPIPKPFRTVNIIRKAEINSLKEDDGLGKMRQIRLDIYLPKQFIDNPSTIALPLIVNLHGSGFMMKNAMGDDADFCQKVANELPCIVIDGDYAKSPELPFPNANLDIDTVLQWIQGDSSSNKHSDSLEKAISPLHFKPDHIALTGFSAGGNLSLTACVRAKQRKNELDKIKAVVAFYPSTNLHEDSYGKPKVKLEKGQAGVILPPNVKNFFFDCYVPKDVHTGNNPFFPLRSSAEISPFYANHSDFPESVTIITCQSDSSAREAKQLAEHIVAGRMMESGNKIDEEDATITKSDPPFNVEDVERVAIQHNVDQNGVLWWEAEGQGHAWDKWTKPNTKPEQLKQEAYNLVIKRLQKALA